MVGETISHYRILEQIGAGGMGVVYRAHDERLDRDVALKVLPPHSLADLASRKRFRKEALTLSKLNHSNIAMVFDFDTAGETDFLVTEYVPGVTLDSRLTLGHLREEELLKLSVQIAAGLEAAHAAGIVHRDLKPGNLRITPDAHLKILDFGLAEIMPRASELGSTVTLTKSQELTGTLPYMAPEQLRGEPTDARSDIWAVGAVIYEMATGRRPFPEFQAAVLINSILNTKPRRPSDLNSEISPGIERIVLKALEKNPAQRYQTVHELRLDLEGLQSGVAPPLQSWWQTRRPMAWAGVAVLLLALIGAWSVLRRKDHTLGGVRGRRSVAVLGFKNLGKPDEAWISTALSEMLTTELSAGGQLRTIPGENVSRMKSDLSLPDTDSLTGDNLTKVNKILRSDLVVLGSYLKIGEKIRVDLRVQDTSGGDIIANVSEVGDEPQFFDLVQRAGETLRQKCNAGSLTQEQLAAARASEPVNTEATRFYSEGLAKLREFDALAARDLLKRAIEADPNNAMAHSALAATWSQLGYDQSAEAESKKAFELSGNLPREQKLSIEARYREHSRDWGRAVDLYRSLWTFFPDDLEYGLQFANAQVSAGNGREALATVQTLRTLPSSLSDDPRIDMTEAGAEESLSDYKREQAATARAINKAKQQGARLLAAQANVLQCWALRNIGDLQQAKAAGEEAREILASARDLRGEARSLTCVANILWDEGNLSQALDMYEQALKIAQTIGAQKDIAGALINIGNILGVQQNLSQSTARYQQALSVALEIGDKSDVLLAQNNLAANLTVEGDFDGARKMLENALQTATETGDQSGAVQALTNLGTVFYSQGDLLAARQKLQESLTKARALELKSGSAAALLALGDLAVTQDAMAEAEGYYKDSLAIRTQLGEQGGIAATQLSLAGLQLEKNQPGIAADLARKAAQEFKAEKMGDQEALARNLVAQSLMAQNNFSEAQSELERARQASPYDKSIILGLDLTLARLDALSGRPAESLGKLKGILERARQLKLIGYEFEARLAQCESQSIAGDAGSAASGAKRLKTDAEHAGFLLIARKAGRIAKTILLPLNKKRLK